MALTKTTELDKMECLARQYHIIGVREVVVVKDGTEIIAEKYKRRLVVPGYKDSSDNYVKTTWASDDTTEYTEVKNLAADCWSETVHSDYASHIGATYSSD